MEKLTLDSAVVVMSYEQAHWDDDFETRGPSLHHATVRELYHAHKDDRYFEANFDPIYMPGDVDAEGGVDDQVYAAAMARGLEAYEQGTHGDVVADVLTHLRESDYGVMSLQEHTKLVKERERERMEQLASQYAKMWNCVMGSHEFVSKLDACIQDHRERYQDEMSGEAKAERWAACQYAGASHSFWDDEDYIDDQYSSQQQDLELIQQWLELNCPLLMASIREQQLHLEATTGTSV